MAVVNFYNPVFPGQLTGAANVVTTSSQITVGFVGVPLTDVYLGSFSYDSNGFPYAGVVTAVQETYNGALSFSISGLAISAPQLANAVLASDFSTIANLLFSGSDQITGSSFGEPIYAGAGNDTVIALDGDDTVVGFDGNDDVNGNVGRDLVLGGAGADIVRGGKDNDTVWGDDGADPHVNGNLGDDSVRGGDGADTVFGGQGSDTVLGDAGNDELSGDLGDDILMGGTGADRFVMRVGGGVDWVADFNAAEGDRVVLTPGSSYSRFDFQGQVVLDLGGGTYLGLVGVSLSSFSTDWVVGG